MKIKCRDCGKDITNGSGSKKWDKYNKSLWELKKMDKWLCSKCHKKYIVGSFFIPLETLNNCNQ